MEQPDAHEQPKTPQQLVDGLVRLLTVGQVGEDEFTGLAHPGGVGRVFGGQVVAQALQAAQASAPEGMQAHSLHAYFLRGGKEGPATNFTTARDFDGRSFANRRVVASQTEDGASKPILNLTCSFQRPEQGLEHQRGAMPDMPPPEELRSDMEQRRHFIDAVPGMSKSHRAMMLRPRPIEMRTIDKLHWMNAEKKSPEAHSWFKTCAALPNDPALHRAVIAYASDYTLLGTAALPHGLSWMRGEINGASLDHAIWFHRPARADEWLLYATESPWSGAGRGFNRGQIFNRQGQLVASVAQEGMLRRREPRAK